jgi:co-chaperonin GroES (HSP10)
MANKKKANLSFELTDFEYFGNYILIKAVRPESKTDLVDPRQYDDKSEFGEVVSAGDEVTKVKPGDIVWFGKYSSEKIRINSEDYFIIGLEDIKGKLRK